jgi:hypothetical protein
MRKLARSSVSAAAILAAGFLIPNHAEALIGAPGTASLAAQTVAPIENVVWCGWRCHRFHHRAFFFHHRPVFAFHRFHHRPFFSPPVGVMGLMPLPQCRPQITRATSTV